MKRIIQRFIKQQNIVMIGDEQIEIKPLKLQPALEFCLLLAPHLAMIENHWSSLERAFEANGDRPEMLHNIFMILREEMQDSPGDMIKALALMLDCDVEWLARNVTAQQFIDALPVLDRVNSFGAMWQVIKRLGLTVKYA